MLWLAVSNPYGRVIRTSPDLPGRQCRHTTLLLGPCLCLPDTVPHCLAEYGATAVRHVFISAVRDALTRINRSMDGYPPRARTTPCPGAHKTHGRRGRDAIRRDLRGSRVSPTCSRPSARRHYCSPLRRMVPVTPAHELRPPDLCIFFHGARATTRFLVHRGPSRSLTTPKIGDNADGRVADGTCASRH
jgi:hypothetical protein